MSTLTMHQPSVNVTNGNAPRPPSHLSNANRVAYPTVSVQSVDTIYAPGSELVVVNSSEPFTKDERIRVIAVAPDSNWYKVRGAHGEALIHASCVRSASSDSITSSSSSRHNNSSPIAPPPMPWFHGNMSRDETERLLHKQPNGMFLVRESTNFPGDYTLCMAYAGRTEHYRIYLDKWGKFTCDNECSFDNLTQLVSHYKRDADGLCHRLVTPLIAKQFQLASIDDRSRIFKDAGLIIRRHELKLGDIVGHGEFGDVHVGYYNDDRVAVKVLKRSGMVNSLLDEALFMTQLKHRNLVLLIGVVLDDTHQIYMVTEFMANGNLVDYLRSRGRHQVERDQLLQFSIDICEGMAYLESKQLIHRDLAARNVLLTDQMIAKISDFGLAKHLNSTNSIDTMSGKFPIKWTAPEALRYSQFSSKSDMWSFGVLLWEIYSFGRVPYPRIPIQDVVRHIEKGYRMESPEGCPLEISKAMSDAWALDPLDRPSFVEMLNRLKSIARGSTGGSNSSPSTTTPTVSPNS